MRRLLLLTATLLILAGLGAGTARIAGLERHEMEHVSELRTLAPTVNESGVSEPQMELTRVQLDEGEQVTFEVCARDSLALAKWKGAVDLVVWIPASDEVAIRTPLDEDSLRAVARRLDYGCLIVGRSQGLTVGGEYAVAVVWPGRELSSSIEGTQLRARVVAHRSLTMADRWLPMIVLFGALMMLVALARPRRTSDVDPTSVVGLGTGTPHSGHLPRILVGLALLVAAIAATAFIPMGGSLGAVGRGIGIAVVEVILAVALVYATPLGRASSLGLVLPPRATWVLALSPFAGLLFWFAGIYAVRLIPATGQAPIEAVVSWPSGSLAVGLVAVVVPLAEELFFRGFVFGTAAQRFGKRGAFALTVMLFGAAHLPQDWGAWGAFTAIMITGAGITSLRWATGSVLPCVLAHLAHNAIVVFLNAF